jgi:NAD(P)-dependent dehydrogenase (short-subunit alcohol dehydrogenase family)
MDIQGRVAIVTGASAGIGLATARRFASEGAKVVLVARSADKLTQLANELRQQGHDALVLPADMRNKPDVDRMVEKAFQHYGQVDILVNNAGIKCHGRPIEDHTAEDWDRVMATNLRSAFLLTCRVLPMMKEKRRGFILMVSSDSGIHHFRNQAVYGISKHGMNALVQFILAECGQYNIHAAALCPGLTDTEMGLSFDPPVRENVLAAAAVARWASWVISQQDNMNVARPLVLSPMRDPWGK